MKTANERRLGPRKRLTLEGMINHSRHGLQRCQTRDISLEGAFVQTDAIPLRRYARIDLILKIPANGRAKHYRVRARVSNVEKHGATLIFRNLDEQTYTALVDLLYPAE